MFTYYYAVGYILVFLVFKSSQKQLNVLVLVISAYLFILVIIQWSPKVQVEKLGFSFSFKPGNKQCFRILSTFSKKCFLKIRFCSRSLIKLNLRQ